MSGDFTKNTQGLRCYASHIINGIHQHTFCKFKSGLKYGTIDKYSDKCEIFECTTCEFINR